MYYGFDIGGTKIALGVFDKDLKLQWETRVPTPRDSYDEFLTAIAALVAQADERFGVKGSVGIGIPGMPETDDGTLYAANVPAASGKPLRADLSALLERDVRLDNDANCFALSEAWDDEFRQYPLVMGLILGTGVGGGIVINGKPITGRSYITGEFGHIRLPVDALEVVGRDFPGSTAVLRTTCQAAGLHGFTNTSIIRNLRPLKSLPCGSKGMRRRVSTSSAIWICWRCVWEIFSPSSTRICW